MVMGFCFGGYGTSRSVDLTSELLVCMAASKNSRIVAMKANFLDGEATTLARSSETIYVSIKDTGAAPPTSWRTAKLAHFVRNLLR